MVSVRRSVREMAKTAERQIRLGGTNVRIEREVAERTEELAVARDEALATAQDFRLRGSALDAAASGVVITDDRGVILWTNRAFTQLTGYPPEEAVGKSPAILQSGETPPETYKQLWQTITSGKVWTGALINRRKDGTTYHEEMTVTPVLDDAGKVHRYIGFKLDVTEREQANEERKSLEAQLEQSKKLEAIGQLAAGIAHEINTPTQYVGDNTRFLEESFSELLPVLTNARDLVAAIEESGVQTENKDAPWREALGKLKSEMETADLEYLHDEIPRAIEQSLEGIDRVRKIVLSMKEFSHPGVEGMTAVDPNRCVENTITVASNEWRYVAEMVTDLDPDLRPVACLPGEINQVILNVIVNAAHAIADQGEGDSGVRGTITCRTVQGGDFAEVQITDTGSGIPESAREKIFEPFFTTKEVGKGTGQGLSIAHGVVTKKHGGTLTFETELGKGTTFFIRLPLEQASSPGSKAA